MTGPAAHEAHETPLESRLVDDAIREWMRRRTDTAHAATGSPVSDYERGKHAGIDDLSVRLDDYWYTVGPAIIDALRRAGLLANPVREAGQ